MQEYWINVYANNPIQTSLEYFEKHPQWLGLPYKTKERLKAIEHWSGIYPIYRIHVKIKNNSNSKLTPIFK